MAKAVSKTNQYLQADNMKFSKKQKKAIRLVGSIGLSTILFIIFHFLLPSSSKETHVLNPILKKIIFALVFGFLPFYILPWLHWIMGHDNDQEESFDDETN